MKVLLSILVLGFLSVQGSQFSSLDPLQTAFAVCDANQDDGLTLEEIKDEDCMEILENLFGVTADVVLEKFLEIVNDVDGQSPDRLDLPDAQDRSSLLDFLERMTCRPSYNVYYSYDERECKDCDCYLYGRVNRSCDSDGICSCKEGWHGDKCDQSKCFI